MRLDKAPARKHVPESMTVLYGKKCILHRTTRPSETIFYLTTENPAQEMESKFMAVAGGCFRKVNLQLPVCALAGNGHRALLIFQLAAMLTFYQIIRNLDPRMFLF